MIQILIYNHYNFKVTEKNHEHGASCSCFSMEIQDDMNNEKESTESLYLSRDEAKSDINKYSINY